MIFYMGEVINFYEDKVDEFFYPDKIELGIAEDVGGEKMIVLKMFFNGENEVLPVALEMKGAKNFADSILRVVRISE